MRLVLSVLLISFLFIQDSWAARRSIFKAKTNDLTVVDKCEDYKPSFFLQKDIKYFLVGTKGMRRAGFHEEINISRSYATTLWTALNPHSKENKRKNAMDKINYNDVLSEYYDVLDKGKEERGADYYSEGEVLEVLSYEYLPDSDTFNDLLANHFGTDTYTKKDYFITGGVKYFSKTGQTVGELDVLVGDSKTCTIFGVGEAKLGGKKSKAVRQLDRFKQFLRAL